jgi:DNA sulfur modification protein DndD
VKLFWLKLKNYRQYGGETIFQFSTDKKKNITIVEGTNGAGKTTILNAVHWCLYGYEPVFKDIKSGVAPTCNRGALDQTNVATELIVEVALGEGESPKYFFTRRVRIWNSRKERPSKEIIVTDVSTQNSEGRTKIFLNANLSPTATFEARVKESTGDDFSSQPDYLVDRILPRDLAFVFLFNGEELKEFFDKHSNLQKALEDISQITLVMRAIKQLDSVSTGLRRDASKGSADTQNLSQELDGLQSTTEEKTRLKEEKEHKIEQFRTKINDIDRQLSTLDISQVRILTERRRANLGNQERLVEQLKTLKAQRNDLLLLVAPRVYLSSASSYALLKIGELGDQGKLPPPIKTVFLRELLEKKMCICGRGLEEHGDDQTVRAHRNIVRLLTEEAPEEAVGFQAMEGRFVLNGVENSLAVNLEAVFKLGGEISNVESDLNAIEKTLETIKKELGSYEGEGASAEELSAQVRSLESTRDELQHAVEELLVQKGGDEREIISLTAQASKKKSQLDEELRKKAATEDVRGKLQFCETSLTQLMSIKDIMVTEVRKEIEKGTDAHFRDLIWKTARIEKESKIESAIDPKKLQRVEIDQNNEISVITKNGENWVRSLSQGETQTLAYAFISALKEGARVTFPMIIDTPLGIIDEGPPRELFAELLPEFVKDTQMIFLMTSAEYTEKVKRILSPRVGATYALRYYPEEETTKVRVVG